MTQNNVNLFDLGHSFDQKGQYQEAWNCWVVANGQSNLRYDVFSAVNFLNHWMSLGLEHITTPGDQGEDLIFIVGMPRSGTTLLEKILASHPDVIGRGELAGIPDIVEWWGLKQLDNVTAEDITMLKELYRSYQPRIEGKKLVDKMPRNFLSVGFIKMLFPQATIIHSTRNREDILLSMYSIDFENKMPFKYRVEDLQLFHYHYALLMEFYVNNGVKMHNVSYEHLVYNFEEDVRQLLDRIELPYNPNCLKFYQHPDESLTASKYQVKQPIYTSSVDRYKNYLPFVRF
jgi:hypothetical protein